MNEEKLNGETLLDDENQSNKESKERISYPYKDLQSMIDFVAKVYEQLGHTDYHSNLAIAAVHGLAPNSIKPHLTSAQQYKLIEIKHRVGYRITEHFLKLYLWKTEAERRSAIIESLKNVETYQQLFKDYEYHIVPTDGVKNHFKRTFGFKEDVAVRASQVFFDNLREFSLLDGRGVLTSAMPFKPVVQEIKAENDEQPSQPVNDEPKQEEEASNNSNLPARQRVEKLIFQSELDTTGKKTVPIYLIGTKQALFVYPDDITEDEIELVKHQIDGVLLRIKIESKAKAQAEKKE